MQELVDLSILHFAFNVKRERTRILRTRAENQKKKEAEQNIWFVCKWEIVQLSLDIWHMHKNRNIRKRQPLCSVRMAFVTIWARLIHLLGTITYPQNWKNTHKSLIANCPWQRFRFYAFFWFSSKNGKNSTENSAGDELNMRLHLVEFIENVGLSLS